MANGLLQMIANPQVADVPGSLARGRQFKLQDIAAQGVIQEQEQKRHQQQQQMSAREGVIAGGEGLEESLLKLELSGGEGAKVREMLKGMTDDKLKKVGSEYFTAFSLGPGPGRDNRLKIAKENATPQIAALIDKTLSLTGEEQEREMLGGIQVLQRLGAIGATPKATKTGPQIQQELDAKTKQAETAASSAKTPEQIQQEIDIRAQVAETGLLSQRTSAGALEQRKAETEAAAGELSVSLQKSLIDIQDASVEAGRRAGEISLLADDFERLNVSGGTASTVSEFLKSTFDNRDEISALRTKFRAIRGSQVMKNLPPGAASDADIKIAQGGVPPTNAGSKEIVGFFRGMAKMATIEQSFQRFKADYISQNKSTSGMLKSWDENKSRIISEFIKDPTTQDSKKVVLTNPLIGVISEQDITDAMKAMGMTRVQVIKELGE